MVRPLLIMETPEFQLKYDHVQELLSPPPELLRFERLRQSSFCTRFVTTRTESTVVAQKNQYIEVDLGLVLKEQFVTKGR